MNGAGAASSIPGADARVPAFDLLSGNAVRLHQGRYDAVTVYSTDPPALAAELRGRVPILHVVDLEGARAGRAVQKDLVRKVIEAFGPLDQAGAVGVQVGGGVRSLAAVESYLEAAPRGWSWA